MVKILPNFNHIETGKSLDSKNVIYVSINKRIFDIISSTIALLLLSPLFLPIMILLKLTSEGEVFYFQERIGMNKKPFKIFNLQQC